MILFVNMLWEQKILNLTISRKPIHQRIGLFVSSDVSQELTGIYYF
jgi:hypothetical protein